MPPLPLPPLPSSFLHYHLTSWLTTLLTLATLLQGENCIAAGRLFIEDSIHDMFVNRVVEEVKKMKIGDPLDRSTAHGPQNHRAHFEKLEKFVERGVKEGEDRACVVFWRDFLT